MRQRAYWVVSPNVQFNERTVGAWRRASVTTRAAFMNWGPNDPKHRIGPKFAGKVSGGVQPGDVMLIARRSRGVPEMVGFGVVRGNGRTRLSGFKPPETFGSLRMLRPFVPWSRTPPGVPIHVAVNHAMALVQLHPERYGTHKEVCQWMESHLKRGSQYRKRSRLVNQGGSRNISIVGSPRNHQLDYVVQTKFSVMRAKRREVRLLEGYRRWLVAQERKLVSVKYGKLECDGYEQAGQNLIEAKSSVSREHIRMAVGQLLDYAFQGKARLGNPNKAVLLPQRPSCEIESWLEALNIKLIWQERGVFVDNANGQFT